MAVGRRTAGQGGWRLAGLCDLGLFTEDLRKQCVDLFGSAHDDHMTAFLNDMCGAGPADGEDLVTGTMDMIERLRYRCVFPFQHGFQSPADEVIVS